MKAQSIQKRLEKMNSDQADSLGGESEIPTQTGTRKTRKESRAESSASGWSELARSGREDGVAERNVEIDLEHPDQAFRQNNKASHGLGNAVHSISPRSMRGRPWEI